MWPSWNNWLVGRKNIVQSNLVDPANTPLPPLHIKQLVKALQKRNDDSYQYVFRKFSKVFEANIKGEVSDGPQIRELLSIFSRKMCGDEKKAWRSFLGNNKDLNYKGIVKELIMNYEAIGCLMSLKLPFLNSHEEEFPENLRYSSVEQGERFHQDITKMVRC